MNSLLSRTLISTRNASVLSGYNSDYLGRLCREGKITASQVGRAWLIERSSLELFMAAQVERKIELAEQISRDREEEYRRANPEAMAMTPLVERKTSAAVNVVMDALARVRFPKGMAFTSSQAFASAVTALVLGASVTLAGSGIVATGTNALLAGALEGRALVINSIAETNELAREKRAELAVRAHTEISTPEELFANAKSDSLENTSLHVALGLSERKESSAFASLAYARAQERTPYEQSTTTFADVRGSIIETVRNPAPVLSSLRKNGLRAYVDIGTYVLHDVDTVLAIHLDTIERAGASLLSIGTGVRDVGIATPSFARDITRDAADAYSVGLYSYVNSIERVPRTIISTLYSVGDFVSSGVATGITRAPGLYNNSIVAYTDASTEVAYAISNTSYEFGWNANDMVSLALDTQDRAIVTGVRSTRNAIAAGNEAIALSTGVVSGTLIDQGLGLAGTIALNLETMEGSVLPASALTSIDTSAFFPSFLRDIGSILTETARSMLRDVCDPLAGFFNPAEELGIAVIPVEEVLNPETALEEVSIVYNKNPVTVATPSYVALNGSTRNDGFVNGAILDVLDTIVNVTLTVHGSIEATDYIAGPYVLATSTTATSAFSGNIAVGRNATIGASAEELLSVNNSAVSNLLSSTTNIYGIDSSAYVWRRGYFGEVVVNGLASDCVQVSGGQLTPTGTTCGAGDPFIQDRNSFGTVAAIGTNDTQTFNVETDGITRISVLANGNVGIGTTAQTAQLHTIDTVSFSNFATGTLQTDASGNVSASSDERLKNVQRAVPEVVDIDNRGYVTLSDRPILATTVSAVKELNLRSPPFAPGEENVAAKNLTISAAIDGLLLVADTAVFKKGITVHSVIASEESASFTKGTPKTTLNNLGLFVDNGLAWVGTLVFHQLAIAQDENGSPSTGSVTVPVGSTVAQIENPYALPTSKIFIAFTSSISETWYMSEKREEGFSVVLSESQNTDISLNYSILRSEGQRAPPQVAVATAIPPPMSVQTYSSCRRRARGATHNGA